MRQSLFLALLLCALAALPARRARADAASDVTEAGTRSTDGAVIYRNICQGCHMANARGAAGAGVIPALAGNPKLASGAYPVSVVLNGRGGMPWFGPELTDVQVAAVVNYVRTHFGNSHTDAVTPQDVAQQRGPNPTMEK